MKIIKDLLATITTTDLAEQITVGPFLTAVEAGSGCGLATTLTPPRHQCREPAARDSGEYAGRPLQELARLSLSERLLEACLGVAAINAALPLDQSRFIEQNGFDFLKAQIEEKTLTLVGHFPFSHELAPLARQCWILEQEPQQGDLPAEAAERVIPDSEVVVITGAAFANHTMERLLELARGKYVVALGPSAPLSPVLFDHGVSAVAGTWVEESDRVVKQVGEGAIYRQLRGVRRVIMEK